MLFDTSKNEELRKWLVSTLEPICDADPDVLSEYVLALLKHEDDEEALRSMVLSQLNDFLENHAQAFVDQLFKHIHDAKMLLPPGTVVPPAAPPAPVAIPVAPLRPDDGDNGIALPLDMLLPSHSPDDGSRGTKRGLEEDEDTERSPPKGPRLSNGHAMPRIGPMGNGNVGDGRPMNGYGGRGWRGGMNGGMNGQMGAWRGGGPVNGGMRPMGQNGRIMNGAGPSNGRGGLRGRGMPPMGGPQRQCRDFYERGFCPRGIHCTFSHGEDAFIPPMMPFFPMPDMAANFPYDMMGGPAPTNTIQPWTAGPPGSPVGTQIQMDVDAGYDPNQAHMGAPPLSPVSGRPRDRDGDTQMDGAPQPPFNGDRPMRRMPQNFRGAPRGGDSRGAPRGRGGYGRGGARDDAIPRGERGFRPGPADKTLVVDKIPPEHLSLEAVNTYFKEFGTVTNIAIDAMGQKALVSYGTHEEALKAWKSEAAVFGSRFVKVLWHRPLAGRGEVGTKALAGSAPLVENLNKPPPPPPAATPKVQKPAPSAAAAIEAKVVEGRRQLLEKQIAAQKVLMGKLDAAKDPAEKKEIMASIRKLDSDMQALKAAPAPGLTTVAAPVIAAVPATRPAAIKASGSPLTREAFLKEKLDKELEIHNVAEDGAAAPATAELMAHLESLKAEAASLGIDADGNPVHSGRGGYRGRGRGGRGRGGPAFRGGPPAWSMKIDNRPRKLIVKGVAVGDSVGMESVKKFYQDLGEIESFDVQADGDIHVQFAARYIAEQALTRGTIIPNCGHLTVSLPAVATSTTAASAAPKPFITASATPVKAEVAESAPAKLEAEAVDQVMNESDPAAEPATEADGTWPATEDIVLDVALDEDEEEREERLRRARR